MRTSTSIFAVCIAILLGAALPARAEIGSDEERFPMTLRVSADSLTGTVNQTTITKLDAGAGFALDAIPNLTLYVDMLIGSTRIGFDSVLDNGLRGRGEMWAYANLSARTGASVRMFERSHWKLHLFSEFESSLIGTTPEVTTLNIKVDEGSFDVSPYANKNAEPDIFWNRFSVGLKFNATFGRFSPGVSVGYQLLDAELDLHVTPEGRETLKRLGFDDGRIEKRHKLSFWSVPIVPEIRYLWSQSTEFGINGTILPAGDSILYGAGGFLRYHL